MKYDALREPNSAEWLSSDEQERIGLVTDYHKRKRIRLPNALVHATFHVAIESQLAEAIPEVRDALDRLMGEGLDRHEAIHAIGSVLAECTWSALRREATGADLNEQYFEGLRRLSRDEWKNRTR